MTSHGKTSHETVTFENHHIKNPIKIVTFTYGASYGSSLCGVIFIKVVKTLVNTVSELKNVFRQFHWCDFRVLLVFIYHNQTRIKIVVFLVSWFRPLCLMSRVLVFLTIHGLGPPVGWFLPSGAFFYGLRLDQIVRFPMIFQLGLCVIAIQFLATLFLSHAFLFQRTWIQQATIVWGSCAPDSPPRIDLQRVSRFSRLGSTHV